jgi:hypothetical protein
VISLQRQFLAECYGYYCIINTRIMETANLILNEKMKKLIYRLKATKTLQMARMLERTGQTAKLTKLYFVSRWYHEQAYKMGYDHSPFLKDFASVLEVCGKNEEARIFYLKAAEEIKSAA